MKKIKIILLYLMKYLGFFSVIRRRNPHKLRILCYHGISLKDEHEFLPGLFMSEELFRHRMNLLSTFGYDVISLDEAVSALQKGDLPNDSVVITFDDGWRGTFTKAVPILQERSYPAAIYITSYYVEKQVPVLNVLLQYILWKSCLTELDLDVLGEEGLSGKISLSSKVSRQQATSDILEHLEKKYPVGERYQFFEKICDLLNVEWQAIKQDHLFRLADPEMIKEYAKIVGVEMELHTHRHVFPDQSFEACEQEVMENQQWLEKCTGKKSRHFCYPSGWYDKKQLPWLERMGVRSATTVRSALNDRDSNLYELDRFLDGQDISDIEFEAELCGVSDWLRGLKG